MGASCQHLKGLSGDTDLVTDSSHAEGVRFGRVKRTGDVGRILTHDPGELSHAWKLHFDSPTDHSEWFELDDVEVLDEEALEALRMNPGGVEAEEVLRQPSEVSIAAQSFDGERSPRGGLEASNSPQDAGSPKSEGSRENPQDTLFEAVNNVGNAEGVQKTDSDAARAVAAAENKAAAEAALEDELSAALASLENPTLEAKKPDPQPAITRNDSSGKSQPDILRNDSSSIRDVSNATGRNTVALDKMEAMIKLVPPAASFVPSQYDVSNLMKITSTPDISDAASRRAKSVFQRLDKDLSQEMLNKISEECFKHALSRDRVAVALEQSQAYRLTCAQLRAMVEMVSLDAHKKQVIYARYAQVVDKDHFREEVLNNFTRSNALRGIIMKELSNTLTGEEISAC